MNSRAAVASRRFESSPLALALFARALPVALHAALALAAALALSGCRGVSAANPNSDRDDRVDGEAESGAPPLRFPEDWVGRWVGPLQIFGAKPQTVRMELHIEPLASPARAPGAAAGQPGLGKLPESGQLAELGQLAGPGEPAGAGRSAGPDGAPVAEYRWRIRYGDGAKGQDRDYRLRWTDRAAGRYVIDEQNGIVLPGRVLGGALVQRFRVGGNDLVATYTCDGRTLRFTVVAGAARGADAGRGVESFPVATRQVAELRRSAAPGVGRR